MGKGLKSSSNPTHHCNDNEEVLVTGQLHIVSVNMGCGVLGERASQGSHYGYCPCEFHSVTPIILNNSILAAREYKHRVLRKEAVYRLV